MTDPSPADPSPAEPTSAGWTAPTVEALTRRLLDAPADWRGQPLGAQDGQVSVAAVVSDLLRRYGGTGLDTVGAAPFRLPPDPAAVTPEAVNGLRCALVACWVLADPALVATGRHRDVRTFLATGLDELASIVPSASLLDDPDRREELARRCLAALGIVPAGETEAQAADRLAALDSAERARVLAATREAERRAEEVRRAMHAKAAAEAAAKASRE